MMDETIFDAATFVAFCDYASAFIAGGFGLSLAFWLVGHAAGRLLNVIREV